MDQILELGIIRGLDLNMELEAMRKRRVFMDPVCCFAYRNTAAEAGGGIA